MNKLNLNAGLDVAGIVMLSSALNFLDKPDYIAASIAGSIGIALIVVKYFSRIADNQL